MLQHDFEPSIMVRNDQGYIECTTPTQKQDVQDVMTLNSDHTENHEDPPANQSSSRL